MSTFLFVLGLSMIAYDFLGHALCLSARLSGQIGARLWNGYSKIVWPSLQDSVKYDLFWSLWFGSSMFLMTAGFLLRAEARP